MCVCLCSCTHVCMHTWWPYDNLGYHLSGIVYLDFGDVLSLAWSSSSKIDWLAVSPRDLLVSVSPVLWFQVYNTMLAFWFEFLILHEFLGLNSGLPTCRESISAAYNCIFLNHSIEFTEHPSHSRHGDRGWRYRGKWHQHSPQLRSIISNLLLTSDLHCEGFRAPCGLFAHMYKRTSISAGAEEMPSALFSVAAPELHQRLIDWLSEETWRRSQE